jgi:salicylate hydroxylase
MARRAIIAGAGIGGLATASALARSDFTVVVYERADTFEEFGAGVQLTPNATRVLSRLGALESLRDVATNPHAICVIRGSDDAVLTRMPLHDAVRRWGAPYLTVHRADLHKVLAEAVRRLTNVDLRLASTVARAAAKQDRITVGLKRGKVTLEDSADLLIGADGLRSRVREQLGFGDATSADFSNRVAFRAMVDSNLVDPILARPEVYLRLGPNAHFVHYPLRGASVINLVAVIESASRGASPEHPWDGVADRGVLDRAFANWSPATRRLLSAATHWRAWPLYSRPALASFSLGRIALVGDAAHPMVPFLAQGAAQAIEDAGAIERIFRHTRDIPGALAMYSQNRVARAARVQIEAQRQGRIYHLRGAMAFARDATMRFLGDRGLRARYDWLYRA